MAPKHRTRVQGKTSKSDLNKNQVADDIATESNTSDRSSKTGFLLTTCCFVFTSILYVTSLYPSVPGGDSGELIAAAYELGVAHPPGYPTFTILAKIFQVVLLPYSNPAWATSFMCAIFGAASSAVLCSLVYRLTGCGSSALLSALSFALARPVWEWSITPEVFALNNFFTTAVLWATIHFSDAFDNDQRLVDCTNINRASYVGCFVCGLAMTNQHTIALYIIWIAMWVIWELHSAKVLNWTLLLKMGVAFSIGLLPYLYLPFSGHLNSARMSWGEHTSWNGIFVHLTRSDYGTFQLGGDPLGQHDFLGYLGLMAKDTTNALTLFIIALAFVGAILGHRSVAHKHKKLVRVYFVMLVFYCTFFSWRSNLDLGKTLYTGIVERFWLQSDLIICLFAGIGMSLFVKEEFIGTFLTKLLGLFRSIALDRKRVAQFIVVAFVAFQVKRNYRVCNQSNNTVVRDFGYNLLNSFPANTIILMQGDIIYTSFSYLHLCEGVRPDLRLIYLPSMGYPWYIKNIGISFLGPHGVVFPGDVYANGTGMITDELKAFDIKTFLDANRGNEIISCSAISQETDTSWMTGYQIWPWRFCHKVVPKGTVFNIEAYSKMHDDMFKWDYPFTLPVNHPLAETTNFRPRSWERMANEDTWASKGAIAAYLIFSVTSQTSKKETMELYKYAFKIYQKLMEEAESQTSVRLGIPPFTTAPVPVTWHRNMAFAANSVGNANPSLALNYLTEAHKHLKIYLHLVNEYQKTVDDLEQLESAVLYIEDQLSKLRKGSKTKS